MLFARKDIPNLLAMYIKLIESFYIELNLRNSKRFISCSYNSLNTKKFGGEGVQWIPALLIYFSSHENHFYINPDPLGLLIKFIWVHINHAAKTF